MIRSVSSAQPSRRFAISCCHSKREIRDVILLDALSVGMRPCVQLLHFSDCTSNNVCLTALISMTFAQRALCLTVFFETKKFLWYLPLLWWKHAIFSLGHFTWCIFEKSKYETAKAQYAAEGASTPSSAAREGRPRGVYGWKRLRDPAQCPNWIFLSIRSANWPSFQPAFSLHNEQEIREGENFAPNVPLYLCATTTPKCWPICHCILNVDSIFCVSIF